MTTLAERVPPEFWPTIDRIDQLSAEWGFPTGLRGMLEQIAIMDPDAIRAVIPAWGAGGADGLPDQMNKDVLRDGITYVTTMIDDRWEGSAWEAFNGDMAHVKSLLEILGQPARMAGDALSEFVDKLELNMQEIVASVLEWAGLILAVFGAVGAVFGGGVIGIIMAVAGLIISVIGIIVNDNQRTTERLNACQEATQRFRDQVSQLGPAYRGGPHPTPRSSDWEPTTTDPNT
jgi:hypothetical protein